MRVLFASTQGAGHFGPLIPFVEACERNGHDVLIVGPPTLKARGYPFRAGATPPDDVLGPLWERMPSLPPGQGDVVVVGTIFARLNVDAMLPTLHEAIEEWRPDVVVRECGEYSSAVAADAHGVPHVRVAVGIGLVEEASLAMAAPDLDDRSPGLAARVAASPYVTCYPEALDPPVFDVRRFRHPAAEAEAEPPADPWPGDDRPLVYVSFGSVAATFPPAAQVYARALEAVAELRARVLLTTGGNEIPLGDVPNNVRVERWVDEAAVLPHAAAAVGHGGAGTTLSAMAAGCPQVVVPSSATSRRTRPVWRSQGQASSRASSGSATESSGCSRMRPTATPPAASPTRCARCPRSTRRSSRWRTEQGSDPCHVRSRRCQAASRGPRRPRAPARAAVSGV